MAIQTLLDSSTSAAATGSWYKTNYNYTAGDVLTVFSSLRATAAGDFYIEASPDQNTVVSVAPIATGTTAQNLTGNYPFIRVQKKANTLGGKVIIADKAT